MGNIVTIVAVDKKYNRTPIFVGPRLEEPSKDLLAGTRRFKTKRTTEANGKGTLYVAIHEVLPDGKKGEVPMELDDSSQFPFRHGEKFDLDDKGHILLLDMLKASEFYVDDKSKWNPATMQRITIEDPVRESKKISTKADRVFEALEHIRNMTATDKADVAFYLHQPANVLSEVQIEAYLKQVAMDTPDLINNAWSVENFKYRVLLRRAVAAGLLRLDGVAVRLAGSDGVVIGADEEGAIHYLRQPGNDGFVNELIHSLNQKNMAGSSAQRTFGREAKGNKKSTPKTQSEPAKETETLDVPE